MTSRHPKLTTACLLIGLLHAAALASAPVPTPPPNTFSIFKSPLAGLPLKAGERPPDTLLFEKLYVAENRDTRYEVDESVSVWGKADGRLELADGIQLTGLKEITMEIAPPPGIACRLELELRFHGQLTGRKAPFRRQIVLEPGTTAPREWTTVSLLKGIEAPDDLDALTILREGGGIRLRILGFSEEAPLRFKPPTVTFEDGRTLTLFDVDSTANIYSTSLRHHPQKSYRAVPWVIVGGALSPDFAHHLREYYPHVAITHFGSLPRMDVLADQLAPQGIRVLLEDTPWLYNQKKHLWQEGAAQFDPDGVPRLALHDANIFLPGAFAAARDVMDQAARAGRDSVVLADWIWPWYGRFGFDSVSVAAFRRILNEADEGVLLTFPEGKRRWRFWDYFDYYHAFRWEPRDLGYEDWTGFSPLPETVASHGGDTEKKRFLLYTALYHYAHLQFTQKLGLYAQEKGLRLELITNPEEFGNGNDFLLFSRLDGVANIFVEYFYVPESVVPGYYNLGYFARPAGETGMDLSLQMETGFSGSIRHYWEAENYLPFVYLLTTGADAAHLKIDFLTDAGVHSRNPEDRRHEHYRRIRLMMHGFQLAKDDRAKKPATSVMNIQRRSIHSQSTGFEIGLRGSGNLGAALAENNIAFDGWGMEEVERHLDDYKTVFLGGWQPTTRLAKTIADWLDGNGDRVLVTHSSLPFETDQGLFNIREGIHWASWQNMVYFADWMLAAPNAGGESTHFGLKAAFAPSDKDFTLSEIRTGDGRSIALSTPASLPGYWTADGGTPLIVSGRQPLVSIYERANGSRIIYLHYNPGRKETRPLDLEVTDLIARHLELPRNGHSQRYYLLPAEIEGGYAYALHDRLSSYEFSLTHNLFGAKPEGWMYPWRSDAPEETLRLRAEPKTNYLLYDWLADASGTVATDEKGYAPVQFGGKNTGLIYLLEDSEAGRKRLAAIRELRAACRDILGQGE